MNTDERIKKLRLVILCLQAHPDNEPDSEFADRISDLEEIIQAEQTVCNYCLEWVDELTDGFGCKECILKYSTKN